MTDRTLSLDDSDDEDDGATPPVPPPPPVAAGEVLGRFTLERWLGAGGMGEVWAATDAELDRPVAVKILGSHWSTSRARVRLLREAQALARLRHEHVVTVFDVGEERGRLYLAMELVVGKTLAEWLRAETHPWREVRDVLLAAGRGLAAAHAAGIVHRDFKPGNVLVGKTGVRVCDFGLAATGGDPDSLERRSPDGGAVPLTRTGKVAGTPAYMSPEQLRGERASARSDQFSFCVALFEALYRRRPFPGRSDPERLRSIEEGVLFAPGPPPFLLALLRRGLAADPDARYPSMDTLLADLAHEPQPPRRRLAIPFLLAAAALGAIGVAAWSAQGAPAPRSVAFVLEGGDWRSVAAERRLAAELLASGRVRVVGADAVAEHLRADRSPERLARELDVDRTIFVRADGEALSATIHDARGDEEDELVERGEDVLAVSGRLAETVRERLRVAAPTSDENPQSSLPKDAAAARKYAEGLALRRAFDLDGARRAFEAARDLDPDAPLVHDALAELWLYLGFDDRAAAASRRAVALSASLRHDERLRVTARAAVAAHDWDAAIEAYRALALLFPDEWTDALAVAETMLAAGRVTDAAAAIEKLERRPADARVLLLRAQVVGLRGQRGAARDLGREARSRALTAGLAGVASRADAQICSNAAQSGEPDEARAACARAIAAYRAQGDLVAEAQVSASASRMELELGRTEEARAILDEVEPRARRVGPNRGLVRVIRQRSSLENKTSHNEQALALAREALELSRILGGPTVLSFSLIVLAGAETERGHFDVARPIYEEAAEVARRAGLASTAALALQNLANLHVRAGRIAEASPIIEEALALYRQVHESYDIAWALDTAGLVATERNELPRAQERIEEAIAVRTANKLIAGQSRQNLADVLLAKGEVERAVDESGRAVLELRAQRSHGEVFALEAHARALLAKGDAGAALATGVRALAIEDPARLRPLRAMVAPTIARAKDALGDSHALAELDAYTSTLPAGGESQAARVALGELLLRHGDARRGRKLLEDVIAEARASGSLLTAANAERLLVR